MFFCKNLTLPHATCYLSTSCLGTFKFFQRLKMTLYFSLSVLSDNFFKTTRITTAVPVSLSSPIMRSSVSPSFTWKQKEKMSDYEHSLGQTNPRNLPFFPLNILISQERRKAANTRPIRDPVGTSRKAVAIRSDTSHDPPCQELHPSCYTTET